MKRQYKTYFKGQTIGIFVLKRKLNGVWIANCKCGSVFEVSSRHLYRRKSCGCLSRGNKFKAKDPAKTIVNILFGDNKSRAKKRGYDWNLTKEEYKLMIFSKCNYCGSMGSNTRTYLKQVFKYNGIDRVNSNVGYSNSNCVPCCKTCNYAKRDLSLEDFQQWLNTLVEFQKRRLCENTN